MSSCPHGHQGYRLPGWECIAIVGLIQAELLGLSPGQESTHRPSHSRWRMPANVLSVMSLDAPDGVQPNSGAIRYGQVICTMARARMDAMHSMASAGLQLPWPGNAMQ